MEKEYEVLRQLIEEMQGWPNEEYFWDGVWAVGSVDEDGEEYPVVRIRTDLYDLPHHGEKMAQYYASVNPQTIKKLLDDLEEFKQANQRLSEKNCAYRTLINEAKKVAGIGPLDNLVGRIVDLRMLDTPTGNSFKAVPPDEFFSQLRDKLKGAFTKDEIEEIACVVSDIDLSKYNVKQEKLDD